MYIPEKEGMVYQYYCAFCGFKRPGALEHANMSWKCPKCGGYPEVRAVPEDEDEK